MATDGTDLFPLGAARYLSLRTFRRDGTPADTPVWAAPLDDTLVVFTNGSSWKVKRLHRDPRCAVAVCGARGTVTGEWHEGAVRVVTDPAQESRAYAALRAKYGLAMRAIDALSWLGGRVRERVVLEIEISPPD